MATASYVIRTATHGDAPSLDACLIAAYAPFTARLDDLPSMAGASAEDIANHNVWVVEVGETIVGGLVLVPNHDFMLLANVAVHPDARGIGLGRRLLELAETETRKRGLIELRLNTHAGMAESISMYARNGWIRVRRDGNRVAMKKTLTS
ncbi:MAG: GNAT family N-acetyltransferase [Alphaproteobacteria bacterium]